MKTKLIILFILTLAYSVHAQQTSLEAERFKALSQIESGDNDLKPGKDGERGRYQMTYRSWCEYEPKECWPNFRYMTNADFALAAAEGVMSIRVMEFMRRSTRWPTDTEWCLLWHAPARIHKPTVADKDYCTRFYNILHKQSIELNYLEQNNYNRRKSLSS
jgi:hypothetical protein